MRCVHLKWEDLNLVGTPALGGVDVIREDRGGAPGPEGGLPRVV
jgi:hypothetical protein